MTTNSPIPPTMEERIDYKNMTGPELLEALGTDAKLWADAFMQIALTRPIDHGTMIGWFANAIMAQYDACHREHAPLVKHLQQQVGRLREACIAIDELWTCDDLNFKKEAEWESPVGVAWSKVKQALADNMDQITGEE